MNFDKSDIEFIDSAEYRKYRKIQDRLNIDFEDFSTYSFGIIVIISVILYSVYIFEGESIRELGLLTILLGIIGVIGGMVIGFCAMLPLMLIGLIIDSIYKWVLLTLIYEKRYTSSDNEFKTKVKQIEYKISNYIKEIHPSIIKEITNENITKDRYNEHLLGLINDYTFIKKVRQSSIYVEGGYDFLEKGKRLIEKIAFHNPENSQKSTVFRTEVQTILTSGGSPNHSTESKSDVVDRIKFLPRMSEKIKNKTREHNISLTSAKKSNKVNKPPVPRTLAINASRIDWNVINNKKKTIGDAGELIVYNYEIEKLIRSDLIELIPQVEHSSQIHGDGLGYDIKSFDECGEEIFIEVKSTKGPLNTPLLFTRNEMDKMEQIGDKYYLYRVTDLNTENKSGSITIYPGCKSVTDTFEFTPEVLKARVK